MMLSEAHTAGGRSRQVQLQILHNKMTKGWSLEGDRLQGNQADDVQPKTYIEFKKLGMDLFAEWQRAFSEEYARVCTLFPELQRRMEYESERTMIFDGLAEDMVNAKKTVQQEQGNVEDYKVPPLAELLRVVGPEPREAISEVRQQVISVKAECSIHEYLMQLQSGRRDRPSSACLGEQVLSARHEMEMFRELLPGAVESMQKWAAAAGSIGDRLDAALVTCNARERLISIAIKRVVNNIRALLALARDVQRGPAAVPPAAVVVPHDRPANSMLGLMNTWTPGVFYDRFVELAMSTNDDTAVFLATQLLSGATQWYDTSACLGGGAFGVVDRIDVHTLGESFALKVIKAGTGEGADEFDRKSQEALMVEMAICTRVPPHPNVVRAVAVDDRSLPNMKVVYELAKEDFRPCARGSTPDSAGTKMRYLKEVAMGAVHLAQHGYVQNDIKPGNVLLFAPRTGSTDGRAALADFGCCLAIGDERRGEGTLGSRPPEANTAVSCHPSAEVFSLGHMCLVTFTKREFKASNMFASEAHMTDVDKKRLDDMEDYSKYQDYRDAMTHRNMTDPSYVGKLLNPEHLLDELADVKVEFTETVGSALNADPTRRPTLVEMVKSLAGMSERLLKMEREDAAAPARETTNLSPGLAVSPRMAQSPVAPTSGGGGGDDGGINIAFLSNVVVGGVLVGGDGVAGGAVVPASTQQTRQDETAGPLVGVERGRDGLPVVGLLPGGHNPEAPPSMAVAAADGVRLQESSERLPRTDSQAVGGFEAEDGGVPLSAHLKESPLQVSGGGAGDGGIVPNHVFPSNESSGSANLPAYVHPREEDGTAYPEVFGHGEGGHLIAVAAASGESPVATPVLEDSPQRKVAAPAGPHDEARLHESLSRARRVAPLVSENGLVRGDERIPRAIYVDSQQEQSPRSPPQLQERNLSWGGGVPQGNQQTKMSGGSGNAADSRASDGKHVQTFGSDLMKANQTENLETDAKYLEFKRLGYKLFSDWQKTFSKEHGRVVTFMLELQRRMEYEAERTALFDSLARDMIIARNAVQNEEGENLGGDEVPPLAELLRVVGPEPLLVVREAREQVASLEAEGMSSVEVLLMQRVPGHRDRPSDASPEKQLLDAHHETDAHYEHLPGLVESMHKRAVAAGSIADRLDAAVMKCNARERLISIAIKRVVNNIRALLALAKDVQRGPAAVPPAAVVVPHDRPANSMLGLMNTWTPGVFYDRFVEIAMSANDDTAVFLATQLLSGATQWYDTSACLGGGAFGVVDRIDVHTLGESFALKVIKAGTGEGAEEFDLRSQEALLVEMAICTRVPPHPNVLRAVAIDDKSLSSMKIAYELACGDFSRCAQGSTPDSAGTKMRYLKEVAMGALHLARHGYVQNDIKPGNVLLFAPPNGNTDGRAALADFGCCLAIGDERRGEGTLGSRPPEANTAVSCHPSAEVFSLGHMCLVTFTKREFKESNMFASEAHMTDLDKDCLDNIEDYSKYHTYREAMTHRNMTDPSYVGKLLNPDHLLDELADMKMEFAETVGAALHADPTRRPSLVEIVKSLAGMSEHLLQMERGCAPTSAEANRKPFPQLAAVPQIAPLMRTSGGDGGINVDAPRNVVVVDVLVGDDGVAGGAVDVSPTQPTTDHKMASPLAGVERGGAGLPVPGLSASEHYSAGHIPEAPALMAMAAVGEVRLQDSLERLPCSDSQAVRSFEAKDGGVPLSVHFEERHAQMPGGGVGDSGLFFNHAFPRKRSGGSAALPAYVQRRGEDGAAYPEVSYKGGGEGQPPGVWMASGEFLTAAPTLGDYRQGTAAAAAAAPSGEARLHESSKCVPRLAALPSEGGLKGGNNRVPQAIFANRQQAQHPRHLLDPQEGNRGSCGGMPKNVRQPTMAGAEENAAHSQTDIGEDGRVQGPHRQGCAPRAPALAACPRRSHEHSADQFSGVAQQLNQELDKGGTRGNRITGRRQQFFEPQRDARLAFYEGDPNFSSSEVSPETFVQQGTWGLAWPPPPPPPPPPQWGAEGLRGVAADPFPYGLVAPPLRQPFTAAFSTMSIADIGADGKSACYNCREVQANGGARGATSNGWHGIPEGPPLPCTSASIGQAGGWTGYAARGWPQPCSVPGSVGFPFTAGQPLFPEVPLQYGPMAAPARVRCS